MIVKRIFDIIASFVGLLVLIPVSLVLLPILALTNGFPIFYSQERVGKNGQLFKIIKLRTMVDSKSGPLITHDNDTRITSAGAFLRKTKLDELPQLINVLKGDMSFVGPRPEVKKYVELYNEEQKQVLKVRPGITDPASIAFRNESELLSKTDAPEFMYIHEIMPKKLAINLEYMRNRSFWKDIQIIIKTLIG